MLTKLKLAIAASAALLAGAAGIAAAHGGLGDGDGSRKAEILAKYDTNHDGVLDANEKAAMKADFQAKRAERKAKLLAQFDTNKDGKLEPNERAVMRETFAAKRFAKLDTNGDGVISKDEFLAAAAKGPGMHRHHRGHQHGFQSGAGAQQVAPQGPATE